MVQIRAHQIQRNKKVLFKKNICILKFPRVQQVADISAVLFIRMNSQISNFQYYFDHKTAEKYVSCCTLVISRMQTFSFSYCSEHENACFFKTSLIYSSVLIQYMQTKQNIPLPHYMYIFGIGISIQNSVLIPEKKYICCAVIRLVFCVKN